MAAQRSGVKTVLIPEENADDLRTVPEEVKNAMEIIPVADITAALRFAGILPAPALEQVG
jgi:ATP-dependent Lon protease